jgi:hypothetical protein
MGKKLMLAAGVATGYVLGTKAGRRRYEQLAAAGRDIKAQQSLKDALQTARDHVVRIAKDDSEASTITMPDTTAANGRTARAATTTPISSSG